MSGYVVKHRGGGGRIVHDLVCEVCDWHSARPVMYSTTRGTPPCPECAQPTRISWHSGIAPNFDDRTRETTVNGQVMQRNQLDDYVRSVESRCLPGQRVVVQPDDDAARLRRREERKQRLHQQRKDRGTDMDAFYDKRRADLAKAKEANKAALKDNKAPAQTDRHVDEHAALVERRQAKDKACAL